MAKLFELIYVGAIITCSIFAARNNELPYKVWMCLVASGPAGEDMSTEVWSDYVDRYLERYPGSYCGKCGSERTCPTKDRK